MVDSLINLLFCLGLLHHLVHSVQDLNATANHLPIRVLFREQVKQSAHHEIGLAGDLQLFSGFVVREINLLDNLL